MALILIVLLVSYFYRVKYGKLWGLMGQKAVSLQKSRYFILMLASPFKPWAPIFLDSGSFSEIFNCFQTGYHNLSEAFPIQATFLLWQAQWTHPQTASLETLYKKQVSSQSLPNTTAPCDGLRSGGSICWETSKKKKKRQPAPPLTLLTVLTH